MYLNGDEFFPNCSAISSAIELTLSAVTDEFLFATKMQNRKKSSSSSFVRLKFVMFCGSIFIDIDEVIKIIRRSDSIQSQTEAMNLRKQTVHSFKPGTVVYQKV